LLACLSSYGKRIVLFGVRLNRKQVKIQEKASQGFQALLKGKDYDMYVFDLVGTSFPSQRRW
jgi:hypothetical protein